MKTGADAAKSIRVVALCANERNAREWEKLGATVVIGDDVVGTVEQLRMGNITFAAFAQRYDGVDLADETCRLLVIDGMPYGEGITDRHDDAQTELRERLVLRIEQGMGRAVRSPADYAVVILAGPELASFTAKAEVRGMMSDDARLQLELAKELADLASRDRGFSPGDAVVDMMRKCINRYAGWKAFYDDKVRKNVNSQSRRATDESIRLSEAEQRAALCALEGLPIEAVKIITEAIEKHLSGKEDSIKGFYIQEKARYQVLTDRAEAFATQRIAHSKNRNLLRPPEGVAARQPRAGAIAAAAAILRWYGQFANSNGAIAEFQSVRTKLSFAASHNQFEQGLKELAPFIGAEGERPEIQFGLGAPDNLLILGNQALVIEAKNEAKYNEIPKGDAEQLLHSMEWAKHNYPTFQLTPVMVVAATKPMNGVYLPDGARIITPQLLENLLEAIEKFLALLCARSAGSWSEKELAQLLDKCVLSESRLLGNYSVSPS